MTLIVKRVVGVPPARGYLGELSEQRAYRLIASISSHSIGAGVAQASLDDSADGHAVRHQAASEERREREACKAISYV